MREIRLGLRLMRGAGRVGITRLALMIGGIAVGVCCLAGALTAPTIVTAQGHRAQVREPVGGNATAQSGRDPLYAMTTGYWGTSPFTVMSVYVGPADQNRPAPGIPALPTPGEVYVSPALARLIAADPVVADRTPGRRIGTIGSAGLASPDDLYAYVGVQQSALARPRELTGFGAPYPPPALLEPSDIHLLEALLAGAVFLPLIIFLSVCVRLSAATRARRLAALRLVGMSSRRVRVVNAVETFVASIAGSITGVLLYCAVDYASAPFGLPGLSWFAADALPSTGTVLICLIGVPFLAWQISRAGARESIARPLAVRRQAPPRTPNALWILPVCGGVALMGGVIVAAVFRPAGTTSHFPISFVPIGVLAAGIGSILAFPVIAHTVAGRLARSGERLTVLLGARRVQHEPGSANRAVALLVLLVFSSGIAVGFIQDSRAIMYPSVKVQEYDFGGAPMDPSDATRTKLLGVPGVDAAGLMMMSTPQTPTDPSQVNANNAYMYSSQGAFIGTCADLDRFAPGAVSGCVDGQIMRLAAGTINQLAGTAPVGSTLSYATASGPAFSVQVPKAVVNVVPGDGDSELLQVMLLIPPSALGKAVPAHGSWVVAGPPTPGTANRVMNDLQAAEPSLRPVLIGVDVDGLRRAALEGTLLALGLGVGGLIAVLAYVIAVTDRVIERRQNVAVLTLLGVGRGTMRRSQAVQMAIPMVAGMAVALIAGVTSARGYNVISAEGATWSWAATGTIAAACGVALLLAVVSAWPVAGRKIDPSLIRRD